MRGKVRVGEAYSRAYRITPAYAGKSRMGLQKHGRSGDHPRLCGEKSFMPSSCFCASGSPPPMRGKGSCDALMTSCARITPAYAGKSPTWNVCCLSQQDHPRLCGEKSRYRVTLWITAGSPPPMRGKDDLRHGRFQRQGITPAYAGKSGSHPLFPAW